MTKFGLQFHAKRDELIDFVINAAKDYNLYIGILKIFSFECGIYDNDNSNEGYEEFLDVDWLVLSQSEPVLFNKSNYQFAQSRHDYLLENEDA